jgi:hypothetical protein
MIPQTVELSAAQDADFTSDEALIWITSPEIFTAGILAREIDDDPVPAIVHVDENSEGLQTGYAWATAYRSLADALRAAEQNPTVQQIWVAKGTYPTAQSGAPRESTFRLRDNLALYGGFAGDETPVEHRNPSLNETVLTGDVDLDDPEFSDCCIGNDSPSCDDTICNSTVCLVDPFCCAVTWDQICATLARTLCSSVCGHRSDNSYHVVTASDTDSTAILDGFTITGGYANEFANKNKYGAGLFMLNGSPTINGCIFTHNVASFGGGIYSFNGSRPNITNCQFVQNASDSGGGFVSGDESAASASPTLVNCLFNGNYAAGAAVDSIPLGNGGAAWIKGAGTFTNCTFHSNRGLTTGGVWNEFGVDVLELTNSVLWGNSRSGDVDEDAQLDSFVGTIAVNYSAVQGWTGQHGGIGNSGDDPQFRDPFGDDGVSGTIDDNLRLTTGSPYIDTGDSLALPSEITTDLDGGQRIVDGDLDGEAIVDRGPYELLPPAGRVPDGATLPGTPLTLGKVGGNQLALSWGPSCLSGDTDYEIYEGSLGDFTSHAPRFCSTSGVSGMTFDAPAGDVYYLIVPTNGIAEGSYGVDHQGNGRPQGLSACFPQSIDGCPP